MLVGKQTGEGKQKYLKHSKNIWREAKTFSHESKDEKY